MLNSRTFNFILILLGGIVAIYAESDKQQSTYILLGGIMLLMIGLYRLSKGIPSKNASNEDDNFIDENE
jgi:putative Mn2+ efflux pump MntP